MAFRPKQILLIDAVKWSDAYSPSHPLCSAPGWFATHVCVRGEASMRVQSAEADLSAEPVPGTDGVIISGSPRDAWSDDPVNQVLIDVIHRCRARGTAVLGVCYGHQVLGRAAGGRVARHPNGWELGNTSIQLTPEGKSNKLFSGMPSSFEALQSHADAVLELPDSCTLLATGSHTAIQGFSWGSACLGVQFHPETSPEVLRYLWDPRRESWRDRIGFDLDARLGSLQPAPLASKIIPNFIHHIIP
ncbi:MAG: type 1 glutamine amidotransferase [Verrucomicrobia bacterium]|nr:type 1 glutamine amidotransferase [Verrucomicrobiota bacterium]